jgi:hypothetical protein
MSYKALEGLESQLGTKPKPKVKPIVKPKPEPVAYTQENVVRVPRTTPAPKIQRVNAFAEAETLLERDGLGKQQHTEERREKVLEWMLNGHLFAGELMTVNELSESLGEFPKTIQGDVAAIKEQMGEFHTTEDLKDVPALAHMLMEMKFQDRGRALALYNIIMGDIRTADINEAKKASDGKPSKFGGLTGRDRASMYSAALQALDLSNKATNGMESLFKITGGAQRLQAIIRAKNLTINNNNTTLYTMGQLQELAADALAGVLPSIRRGRPELPMPKTLELDADDIQVLKLGEKHEARQTR